MYILHMILKYSNCNLLFLAQRGTLYLFFAYWVILYAFLSSANFFKNLTFLKKSFRTTIRVSNSLDPDQARHFVTELFLSLIMQDEGLGGDRVRIQKLRFLSLF